MKISYKQLLLVSILIPACLAMGSDECELDNRNWKSTIFYGPCAKNIDETVHCPVTCQDIEQGLASGPARKARTLPNPFPASMDVTVSFVCPHEKTVSGPYTVYLEEEPDLSAPGAAEIDGTRVSEGRINSPRMLAAAPKSLSAVQQVFIPRGSPVFTLSIGNNASGICAGKIQLLPQKVFGTVSLDASLLDLKLSANAGVDIIPRDEDGAFGSRPWQVCAKDCYIEIDDSNASALALRFYHSEMREEDYTEDGYYQLREGVLPYVTYCVTRPATNGQDSVLRIVESREGLDDRTYEFSYRAQTDGNVRCGLTQGNGARMLMVSAKPVGRSTATEERYEIEEKVTDASGTFKTVRKSMLALGGVDLLTEQTVSDGNSTRRTVYEYVTDPSANGYQNVSRETSESGLVKEYRYDEWGRVLWQRTAVPGLPDHVNTYSYAPLGVQPECLRLWNHLEDDGETEFFTARVETESVGGEVVSKTLRFLATDHMQHRIVEEVKLADPTVTDLVAAWSAEGNVRHYIDYMPKNENKPCSEKKSLEVHQDGTVDVYSYSAGVYTPGPDGATGVFVDSGCGEGDWFRTVVTHYPVQPTMDFSESNTVRFVQLPYQSTREVTIEMRSKKETVLSEQYVCTGVAPENFARISWTSTSRDALGQATLVVNSDGTRTENSYVADRLVSSTDEEGLATTYTYDALGRVVAETKSGGGVRPDTVTTMTYDSENRILSRTIAAGDLSETTTYAFDALGRRTTSTAADGVVTRYLYSTDPTLGLETSTTIRAFGTDCAVTNTIISYADGRTKETLLNGVVKTAYAYGPNWTKTYEGPAGLNSPRWSCSYDDALGRTICETRPGFRGALLITSNEYNTANQLVATRTYSQPSQPSQPSPLSPLTSTYFCYNNCGERCLTVSDMNLNNQIDWNDTDRIVSNDTRYVSLNGDWWRESSSWQTRQGGSSELTLMGRSRTRLTGLGGNTVPSASSPTGAGAGLLTSETCSLDPLNNETISCTYLDRSSHTTTQTTLSPDSTLPAEVVVQSGLTVSSRSATGVTTTYAYDALGRQISQTDGRGNTSHLVYDAQDRVAKTIDALGHETTYAYDTLGRQVVVTDPLGHTVTTTYDAEGRVLAQRGATYPVDYAYDAYGNKVSMTTYRDEALASGDTTRWLYDEPSGCMTNKVYADGKGPSYSYTPDGRLARRVWARGIATDYTYDNAGNLTRTEYDDNGVTPTITMSYDRVGNLVNATTAGVVTNLYAYDLQGHCTNEWQNDFNLTRYYDTLGRSTSYAINGIRQTTIAYDSFGRISTMAVPTAAEESDQHHCSPLPLLSTFQWSYLQGSDLKSSLTYPNGLTASWTYDANNQLLQVRNATPTNIISQFDYAYDAAGRRTAIAKSGTAFGDLSGSVDRYGYNQRSEVTSSRRTKNGQPVQGFSEDFAYDPIGNRKTSSTYNEKGEAQTSTYQANNLNQYTSRTTPGYAAVRGEADPDATVTVNENPTFRLGEYYFGSDTFDNSTAGGLANLETYAVLASPTNGPDEISAVTSQVYLAQSPETFAYDDDGNQTLITTKTGRWHVTYNGENRPVRWVRESDNTTIAMSYDHMGRRREKNAQRFFYDGYLQVVDNGGNFYTWDCTERVATRPLAWSQVDSVAYYTHDGNKNVSEVIVSNNSIVAHYEYAPFGAVILKRGESATVNPWGFSSEFADAKLGCVYYNYREYEPVEGRWLSRDSIQSHDIVSFVFCHNRIIRPDRLGLTDDVIVEGLGAAWAGWELTLGDKTAVRLSGEHFYVTGQPPKGSWVPKSGSTSPLIIYKADNPKKIFRLDYHPLDDTAGMPVWHYNKTRGFARIRELSVANHATIRSAAYTGRLLTVFRYGGRAMFVAGGATSAFQIYKASNRVREASVQVSGWAGGIVGAKIGSGIGGRLGVALTVIAGNIGPQAVVPEEVVTVPASFVIGSGIGGIAGGVIGSISGVTVAEKVYDWAFTPGECDQYVICGEE